MGAESAMVTSFEDEDDPRYNGHDGFGDANLPRLDPEIEHEHAVTTIIDLAMRHKGKLYVLKYYVYGVLSFKLSFDLTSLSRELLFDFIRFSIIDS